MWFLRCPACTPKVPSNASIICGAVTSLPPVAAAPEANMGTLQIAVLAVRSTRRAPRRKTDDFIFGGPLSVDELGILQQTGSAGQLLQVVGAPRCGTDAIQHRRRRAAHCDRADSLQAASLELFCTCGPEGRKAM